MPAEGLVPSQSVPLKQVQLLNSNALGGFALLFRVVLIKPGSVFLIPSKRFKNRLKIDTGKNCPFQEKKI